MNRLLLLTLFSLFAVYSNAQTEEPDPLSFFPHQVGDTWVYQESDGKVRQKIVVDVRQVAVDTTYIDFGQTAAIRFIDNKYNVYFPLPGYTLWEYKLNAQKEETWTVRPANIEKGDPRVEAYVANVYQTILFGRSTTVKEIAYFFLYNGDTTIDGNHAVYGYTRWLASGIGLVQELLEGSSEMEFILTGCVINGDTLGVVTDVPESALPSSFSIQAFPNPCSSLTAIRCTSLEGMQGAHIELVDMFGRTVYSADIQNDIHTINTTAFPNGLYFCRVTTGAGMVSGTLFVQSTTDSL